MTVVLVRKLLRDIRLSLLGVAILLFAFECLWARITHRISTELFPDLTQYVQQLQKDSPLTRMAPLMPELQRRKIQEQMQRRIAEDLQRLFFKGPGKLVQSLIGGEGIQLVRAQDTMSVGLVHPLVQVILCIWAIGRAAGAVAGEIDRGTMELLLSQPVPRWKLIWSHFCIDVLTIPLLCLSLWAGIGSGAWLTGLMTSTDPKMQVDPWPFGPALINTGMLVFAISGGTMLVSAMANSRNRVLGIVILVVLVQFLANLFGQIWEPAAVLRPYTVFYYYQPQPIILDDEWISDPAVWTRLGVLASVGLLGYLGAILGFQRRDLPAPI